MALKPTTAQAILKALDLIVLGITLAPSIKAAWDEYRAKLQVMIAEGRDPTEDEWNELLAIVNKNSQDLQS